MKRYSSNPSIYTSAGNDLAKTALDEMTFVGKRFDEVFLDKVVLHEMTFNEIKFDQLFLDAINSTVIDAITFDKNTIVEVNRALDDMDFYNPPLNESAYRYNGSRLNHPHLTM